MVIQRILMLWFVFIVYVPRITCGAFSLIRIKDIPLSGDTSRFDYASFDSAQGLLYLNHMGMGEVVVFNVKTQSTSAVLKGFPGCTGNLFVPSLNRLFVSASSADQVVAVDSRSLKVLARVTSGGFPDGLAFDPVTRRLFVSDEAGQAVTVIDALKLKGLGNISLGGEAGNTRVDTSTHTVYTNDQSNGDLVAIELAEASCDHFLTSAAEYFST